MENLLPNFNTTMDIFNTSDIDDNILFDNVTTEMPLNSTINSIIETITPEPGQELFKIATSFLLYSEPFLLVFGLTGHVLSFLVFYHGSLRSSVTAFLFRMIAVNEFCFLLLELTFPMIENYTGVETVEVYTLTCQLWNFSVYTCRDCAAWALTMVSVERLIGVVFPHRVKTLVTKKRAYYAYVAITLLVITKNCLFLQQSNPLLYL